MDFVLHDKKLSGAQITLVRVEQIGQFELRTVPAAEVRTIIDNYKRL